MTSWYARTRVNVPSTSSCARYCPARAPLDIINADRRFGFQRESRSSIPDTLTCLRAATLHRRGCNQHGLDDASPIIYRWRYPQYRHRPEHDTTWLDSISRPTSQQSYEDAEVALAVSVRHEMHHHVARGHPEQGATRYKKKNFKENELVYRCAKPRSCGGMVEWLSSLHLRRRIKEWKMCPPSREWK